MSGDLLTSSDYKLKQFNLTESSDSETQTKRTSKHLDLSKSNNKNKHTHKNNTNNQTKKHNSKSNILKQTSNKSNSLVSNSKPNGDQKTNNKKSNLQKSNDTTTSAQQTTNRQTTNKQTTNKQTTNRQNKQNNTAQKTYTDQEINSLLERCLLVDPSEYDKLEKFDQIRYVNNQGEFKKGGYIINIGWDSELKSKYWIISPTQKPVDKNTFKWRVRIPSVQKVWKTIDRPLEWEKLQKQLTAQQREITKLKNQIKKITVFMYNMHPNEFNKFI